MRQCKSEVAIPAYKSSRNNEQYGEAPTKLNSHALPALRSKRQIRVQEHGLTSDDYRSPVSATPFGFKVPVD